MSHGNSLALRWWQSCGCAEQEGSSPLFLLFFPRSLPAPHVDALLSAATGLFTNPQVKVKPPTPRGCLGNTSRIPAATPFHPPVSKAEASRQPNPIQGTAPATPSSPWQQLQNRVPVALPLMTAWLAGKPVQGVELAKNPALSGRHFLVFHWAESALCRLKFECERKAKEKQGAEQPRVQLHWVPVKMETYHVPLLLLYISPHWEITTGSLGLLFGPVGTFWGQTNI